MGEIAELLTTKEMQELLHVDRSTIYRMAEAGQLPAIKVGKQWRFPAVEVENWLRSQTTSTGASAPSPHPSADREFDAMIPLECIQLIQDAFADLLKAQLILTDLEGSPITRVSNPCPFFELLAEYDQEHTICRERWKELGQTPAMEPQFTPSLGGLLCARAFVRMGNELKAMVIIFGVAPDKWQPGEEVVREISAAAGIPPERIYDTLDTVFRLSKDEKETALTTLKRIADILSHVGNERAELLDRLESIAELSAT